MFFYPLRIRRGGASKIRRLILLLSVGWVPPYLHPSGACLNLGTSVPVGALNAAEGYTKPGLRLFQCTLGNLLTEFIVHTGVVFGSLQGDGNLLGNGPHEADQLPRDGHGHHIGVFALGHQALVAFTQADLRLPTDVLNHVGLVFETQLQLPADLRGIAVRPGAFDQHAAGMGVTRFRHPSLLAPLARGIFGWD